MECSGSSTLVLSLKNEQLMLHTAQARTIKAMVEQFLSELKKASVGWPALPGLPGSRLEFRQGPGTPGYGWEDIQGRQQTIHLSAGLWLCHRSAQLHH